MYDKYYKHTVLFLYWYHTECPSSLSARVLGEYSKLIYSKPKSETKKFHSLFSCLFILYYLFFIHLLYIYYFIIYIYFFYYYLFIYYIFIIFHLFIILFLQVESTSSSSLIVPTAGIPLYIVVLLLNL